MTDRSTDHASQPSDDHPSPVQDPPANHLVCAYSPRWLSGPSHYEGLVATFSSDPHDDAAGEVTPGPSA